MVLLFPEEEQNETALNDFLDYVTALDWPFEASEIYGRIRADIKGKGPHRSHGPTYCLTCSIP